MAQDILITPGSGEPQILFRGSGTTDTAIELNVLSSYQSATGSGTAILFEGTEGQLFGITDNLSSGTIFSVGDIAGLPLIEADASGDVQLIEYGRYVGVGTGTPAYQFDVFGTGRFSDYLIVNGNITGAATGIFDGGVTYPDGLTQKNAWPSEVVSSGTASITLSCEKHANKYLRSTNASSVTVTVPSGLGCEPNTEFKIEQAGAGSVNFSAASGVTLNSFNNSTGIEGQYRVLTLKQVDIDVYTLYGDNGSAPTGNHSGIAHFGSNNLITENTDFTISDSGKVYSKVSFGSLDDQGNKSGTITFNAESSNFHLATLTGNSTLAITGEDIGQKILIRLRQNSVGGYIVNWWNNIKWAEGGTEPTLTTASGKADMFGFIVTSGTGPYFYDGFIIGQNI